MAPFLRESDTCCRCRPRRFRPRAARRGDRSRAAAASGHPPTAPARFRPRAAQHWAPTPAARRPGRRPGAVTGPATRTASWTCCRCRPRAARPASVAVAEPMPAPRSAATAPVPLPAARRPAPRLDRRRFRPRVAVTYNNARFGSWILDLGENACIRKLRAISFFPSFHLKVVEEAPSWQCAFAVHRVTR